MPLGFSNYKVQVAMMNTDRWKITKRMCMKLHTTQLMVYFAACNRQCPDKGKETVEHDNTVHAYRGLHLSFDTLPNISQTMNES